LHICARDRRGFFANVAGTLTAQGVNILSVSLNTRADGIIVDTFKVADSVGEPLSDPQRWEQIDDQLKRALSGELDVSAAVTKRLRAQASSTRYSKKKAAAVPTKIFWDNQSSEKRTILEVKASDRLGLAYRIANVLASLGLDISFAKVATEKHLAYDIFYVTEATGHKLKDDALPRIETVLYEALSDSPVQAAQAQ
jgi:[protein-PII] uridylyltransferase